MRRTFAVVFALTACSGGDDAPSIHLQVTGDHRDAVAELAGHVPYDRLEVTDDASGADIRIEVSVDDRCAECYELAPIEGGIAVRGGGVLGVQYGVTHALELLGFRFFHPWQTFVPRKPAVPDSSPAFAAHEPDIAVRGLQLHTLHPIEPYYAFWEPGDENLADAKRVIDWLVKGRGNYLQWVALDNIQRDAAAAQAWTAHTQAILDYAHARGVRIGANIQVFGAANLQQAFDLLDTDEELADPRPVMEARLPLITDLPFDNVTLSFGEFFSAEPQQFIDTVNVAADVITTQLPGVGLGAKVHVGKNEELIVQYQDQEMLYYFLVQFADERIVPWVHTVMYYNLFEDAGGAYHHDEFAEHREFLLARLAAGEPVNYFPETAYWVAFDNSVPVYLPLYIYSRWLDLAEIRKAADAAGHDGLQEHVIFSSGWEWGYWQNDYTILRASYTLPERWQALVEEMFAPLGDHGADMAARVIELTELQHGALIENRLTAYHAGRDVYIDLGDDIDIVSQPDRPVFKEVVAMTDAERDAFEADVLVPLEAYVVELERLRDDIAAIDAPRRDVWYAELADGAAVTAARSRFLLSLYRAVISHTETGDDAGHLAEADAAFDAGMEIVERRHDAMHHPRPDLLDTVTANATLYQYGYLKQADDLCYWERERAKVRNLLFDAGESVRGCVF